MKGAVITVAGIVVVGAAILSGFGGTGIVLPFAAMVGVGAIGLYLLRRRPPTAG